MKTDATGDVAIRWDQDRRRRVVEVRGVLTPDAAPHLLNSVLGVGSRHLVLDLNAVSAVDEACVAAIVDVVRRLRPGQVEVRAGAGLTPIPLPSALSGEGRREGEGRERH